MAVAVWTDSNENVRRKHYKPEQIDTSDADDVVDSDGSPPDVEPWVELTEKFNPDDGFYYETEDPFDGLAFTESEKHRVYDAVEANDLVEVRNIIEEALST